MIPGGQDSLELSEVQKPQKLPIQFSHVERSLGVITVREYPTSGVLYSWTSQLGGKEAS